MDPLLFVYGSLQRGGEYHRILLEAGGTFLAEGQLRNRYPLLLADYPCLLDQPGAGFQVEGEVYRMPEARGWKLIDHLEGHPFEYRRRLECVDLGDEAVQAWTYFYRHQNLLDANLQPVPRYRPSPR
jgi:gamma-glutamylcyclotransferase (GGCT)/AIG2-like uncharacterized protein YtfP